MLKKSASGVLASFRGSTYSKEYDFASLLAAAAPVERRVPARRGWAGEMSGLFEHPAGGSNSICDPERACICKGLK
jgi:hypothetical protein